MRLARLTVPVTITISAFLLFQVQPIVAKALLPWFGGVPAVWTVCMLFFQGLLLAGYIYAHLLVTSLPLRWQALVQGVMVAGGQVNASLGRHPLHRTRRAVVTRGKEAVTHYRIIHRFRAHTELQLKLETGRTHQIRVHMAYLRHPLVGDRTYGGRLHIPAGASPALGGIQAGEAPTCADKGGGGRKS